MYIVLGVILEIVIALGNLALEIVSRIMFGIAVSNPLTEAC